MILVIHKISFIVNAYEICIAQAQDKRFIRWTTNQNMHGLLLEKMNYEYIKSNESIMDKLLQKIFYGTNY